MHPSEKHFLQLAAQARRAEEAPLPEGLPLGLDTRVLAQLRAPSSESPWEFLALRSLPLAAATAAVCLMVSLWTQPVPNDAEYADLVVESELVP